VIIKVLKREEYGYTGQYKKTSIRTKCLKAVK